MLEEERPSKHERRRRVATGVLLGVCVRGVRARCLGGCNGVRLPVLFLYIIGSVILWIVGVVRLLVWLRENWRKGDDERK